MLDFALTALASILFVVDPVGVLPAYLAMTHDYDRARRRRTAYRASVIATLVLAGFAACGNSLFRVLGLTMPAFQIAGGVILFFVAMDMLRAQRPTQEGPEEISEGTVKEDIAVTPLAVPMLAGPAALSTVTMLMSRAESLLQMAVVYLAILLTGVAILLTLIFAEALYRVLGRTGAHVLTRILGLVLATIAVQFMLDGLRAAGAFGAV
ncbi:MAG: MarC family protein [Candidatus Binatia bacterium]